MAIIIQEMIIQTKLVDTKEDGDEQNNAEKIEQLYGKIKILENEINRLRLTIDNKTTKR